MFDVITFGSAAWDIFVEMPPKYIKKDDYPEDGPSLVLNMGLKADIADMRFRMGGGGINTAMTFSRQGLNTAYCGMVGDDIRGREIVQSLKRMNIDIGMVNYTKERTTNNSIVLNVRGKDRVILVYRGASELLEDKHIDWERLNARLFYLAPLSGKLCRLTEKIVTHAKKNGMLVAANLGNSQLAMGRACVKSLLARIDVLILNKEEAAMMAGVAYDNEKKIISETARIHNGINVITKGREGAVIVANGKIYEAKLKNFKVVNVTGAGDAFASAFMSGMLEFSNDVEYSMKLALVNAKHCLTSCGSDRLMSKEDNRLIEREDIKIKICQL